MGKAWCMRGTSLVHAWCEPRPGHGVVGKALTSTAIRSNMLIAGSIKPATQIYNVTLIILLPAKMAKTTTYGYTPVLENRNPRVTAGWFVGYARTYRDPRG